MAQLLEAPPSSPVAQPSEPPVDMVALPLARLTGEQYDRMVEVGILTTEDRLELIDGLLVKKMTKDRLHSLVVRLLGEWFDSRLNSTHAEQEAPIALNLGRPEPDIAIIAGKATDYLEHPTAADVRLLIEVAESSLAFDTGLKATTYAKAGIAPYIVVDLASRQFLVHTEPTEDAGYKRVETATEFAVAIDGEAIGMLRVDDVFPPAKAES